MQTPDCLVRFRFTDVLYGITVTTTTTAKEKEQCPHDLIRTMGKRLSWEQARDIPAPSNRKYELTP